MGRYNIFPFVPKFTFELSPQRSRGGGYGYMDEQKADMITTWVENQTAEKEPEFHALTQFKTCDMEDNRHLGQQHQVQQHRHLEVEVHQQQGLKEVESDQPPTTAPASDLNPLSHQISDSSQQKAKQPPPPPPPRDAIQ